MRRKMLWCLLVAVIGFQFYAVREMLAAFLLASPFLFVAAVIAGLYGRLWKESTR